MKNRTKAVATVCATIGLIAPMSFASAADKPIYVEVVSSASSAALLTEFATTGDVYGKYTLPGTPDGMGAYKNADGTISLLVNHEFSLTNTAYNSDDFIMRDGAMRAAGQKGSTVSKLILDPVTLKVKSAYDAIKKITWWDYEKNKYGSAPTAPAGAPQFDAFNAPVHGKFLNRFCAAYLSPAGALKGSGLNGWSKPLFLTSEESGNEARSFALDPETGELIQLPRFGLGSSELPVVASNTGDDTIVFINEDAGVVTVPNIDSQTATMANMAQGDQLRMYVGRKTSTGSFADRAGFTNGYLTVVKIAGVVDDRDFRTKYGKGKAVAVSFPEVNWESNGDAANIEYRLKGTSFARIEDGGFNPANPNEYWFQTTRAGVPGTVATVGANTRNNGGLWKLTFVDVAKPNLGATVELVLDGNESILANMPDNFDFSSDGRYILLQEDPGANDVLSRVVAYDTVGKTFAEIAQFKAAMFDKTQTATFITNDEESSGMLNVSKLLAPAATGDTFFFNAQVHPYEVGVLNAEVPLAKTVTKMRPDLDFPTDQSAIDFKTKVIEGGQIYRLDITDWTKLAWKAA